MLVHPSVVHRATTVPGATGHAGPPAPAGEPGLREITFGEFLVEQGVLDRFALFRALQMQDRISGARIGECIAALGYAQPGVIERLFAAFVGVKTVTVD